MRVRSKEAVLAARERLRKRTRLAIQKAQWWTEKALLIGGFPRYEPSRTDCTVEARLRVAAHLLLSADHHM
jgi:hypothetical protein